MKARDLSRKVAQISVAAVCATQAHADQAWSDENIARLLGEMTLEEKVMLTSGRDAWSTQPIDRLEIPFIWMADGPHGLRRAPSTDTWGYGDQLPATCFPTASALAATWDLELLRAVEPRSGKRQAHCM